ncbi:unnamed protein product [Larinioides sclopetarius]
MPYLC